MNTIFCPFWAALRISFAISWPIFTSNSRTSSHATGENPLFQNFWRTPASDGRCAQHLSIFFMSQPAG